MQVVWFKRDLRITDHAPLRAAAVAGPVLALYVYEDALLGGPDADARHLGFLNEALDDLDALTELADLSGPGFTSLPVDEAILKERLEKSDRAFHGRQRNLQYGKYLMMMEEVATGQVVGCSAVKAGTGIDAREVRR